MTLLIDSSDVTDEKHFPFIKTLVGAGSSYIFR